ncbi:hypothetical protein F4778DRAFT_707233 [Xylariomycetidae sp. FL2044]|nr:hypothetical protein F4778DRAFT_707233 [Xylariomycetidae sp. FL2044]
MWEVARRRRDTARYPKAEDTLGRVLTATKHLVEQPDETRPACHSVLESLYITWDTLSWDQDEIEILNCMEVTLQLTANALEYGVSREGRWVFRPLADKATEIFGFDDQPTVWVLIMIGFAHQAHPNWDANVEWFDEAFAAARGLALARSGRSSFLLPVCVGKG